MPFIGSIIPANVARIDPRAEKVKRDREDRKRVPEDKAFARALDEAEITSVEEIPELERTQGVPEPESEAGREDREKHGYYGASGQVAPPPGPPHIDLAG